MKYGKIISMLAIMLMLIAGFVGCAGADTQVQVDLENHVLIGVWNWDENTLWQYTFNADGTGARGLPDSLQTFTWSDRGEGHVRIAAVFFLREEWNYTINNDILTISSRQAAGLTYRYHRDGIAPTIDPSLVGEWTWDDNWLYEYVFYDDGTGWRGLPDWIEELQWTVPGDGHLRIDIAGGMREEWNYTINGDTFSTESRQFAGISHSYTRKGAEPILSPELFGTWIWDENELYEYVFYEDGTGWRGLPDWIEEFSWGIPGEGHLRIFIVGSGIREDWNYIVDEDIMTLESRQMANVRFSYIRANE